LLGYLIIPANSSVTTAFHNTLRAMLHAQCEPRPRGHVIQQLLADYRLPTPDTSDTEENVPLLEQAEGSGQSIGGQHFMS
jgi:hypothetical protein